MNDEDIGENPCSGCCWRSKKSNSSRNGEDLRCLSSLNKRRDARFSSTRDFNPCASSRYDEQSALLPYCRVIKEDVSAVIVRTRIL